MICLGASGKPLSGKRCTAAQCKAEYSKRRKESRAGNSSPTASMASTAPTAAAPPVEVESLARFQLWELRGIFGRRDVDPDQLTPYELRNGVDERREEQYEYLIEGHWKEDKHDMGRIRARVHHSTLAPVYPCILMLHHAHALTHARHTPLLPDTPASLSQHLSLYACSQVTWVKLEELVHQLDDEELGVLDAYELANPNADWVDARQKCRAALAEPCEDA